MDDLVVWLRQQIDKDQRVATKAKTFRYDHPLDAPWERARIAVEKFGGTSSDALIAVMNPDRVLGEVEAKRRILEIHKHVRVAAMGWGEDPVEQGAISEKLRPAFPGTSHPWVGCKVCEWDYDKYDEPTGDGDWCDTVKLLALPYSDRSGYREEEWKP